MSKSSPAFPEQPLLLGLLIATGTQTLAVQLASVAGLLRFEWMAALLIALGFAGWVTKRVATLDPAERRSLAEPWRALWPWLIIALLLVQIIVYPAMMHDSLSYRLPRMFLALQEGRLSGFSTTDNRMVAMPWGWESLALPFASLNLVGWSRLIALSCWAVVYQLLFRPARNAGAGPAGARWLALAFATAPFFMLQAASTANDLLAGTLLLAGMFLMMGFHREPGPGPVLGSLLALVLAANVKPQFLVLGLPWLVWWVAAPGRPGKRVRPVILAAAAPLFFFVSPLPLLIANHLETGSISGHPDSRSMAAAPAWRMIPAGTIQFLVPQLQLPVFPASESVKKVVRGLPGMDALGKDIPKFAPGVSMMPSIDGASFGLVHFTLLAAGILAALRRSRRLASAWLGAVLLGFLIAGSQVVVSTMARSFAPFLVVLTPLAAMGLAGFMDRRASRIVTVVACLAGLATLLLNPSAPLWPVATAQGIAREAGKAGLVSQLDHYLAYQERARVGAGILDPVPDGETVGVLIRQVTPLAALWQPDWRKHRIEYVHELDAGDFQRGDTDWLLIAGKVREFYPEAYGSYSALEGWHVVESREYLPNISQGPDTWTLYTRSDASP